MMGWPELITLFTAGVGLLVLVLILAALIKYLRE